MKIDKDETLRKRAQRQLIGWKAIGRHVGRSPRATQSWEMERGLPVHRIPGGRGQSVFAYVDEIDAWMHGTPLSGDAVAASGPIVEVAAAPVLPGLPILQAMRPPGILVLPFDTPRGAERQGLSEALCQQIISRLSAVQPVRVLSWTTSRTACNSIDPLDTIATRLHVRYVVEGAIEQTAEELQVDVRVIDAELDQLMLANRFVISLRSSQAEKDQVADGVAIHFALIHGGALVEPMCLDGVTPSGFLDYLAGARSFFEDPDGTSGRSLAALERALHRDPNFVPARALRGLALLRTAGADTDGPLTAEARSIAASCSSQATARVTTAFLDAAIERTRQSPGLDGQQPSPQALRWIPPSIASEGRLYERRSPLRPRGKGPATGVARDACPERQVDRCKPRGQRLFDEWLQTIVASHRPQDERRVSSSRIGEGSSIEPGDDRRYDVGDLSPKATSAADDGARSSA